MGCRYHVDQSDVCLEDDPMLQGACVPGLSVAAREFPKMPGVLTLENPEVGSGVRLNRDYSLEEVAEMHIASLEASFGNGDFTLCGYSMGGMVVAIMASLFRSKLPKQTRFVFLMTSPNQGEADPTKSLDWSPRVAAVRSGTEEEYAVALEPYFSETFLREHPRRFSAYVRYRALGLNGQTREALFRQILAMQRCRASEYFARIDPTECAFIGSRADRIFGPAQNLALMRLCPTARHEELISVGHMIHHESPNVVRNVFNSAAQPAAAEATLVAAPRGVSHV